jgi:hypothetical protein
MNPILKRLAALRWKVRLLDGWLGICALVALVLGVVVGVGVIDSALHLPNLVRAVALVSLLVGSGFVAWLYLVKPFAQPCDDLNLALRVEDAYPELNDSLASAVQFLALSPEVQTRVGGSEAMRQKTMQDAVAKASLFDFNRILDRRSGLIFSIAAGLMLAIGAGVVIAANTYRPGYASIAFWRFFEPFGPHTWTRIAVAREFPHEEEQWRNIDPRKADSIAVGQPYHIRIDLEGQLPKSKQVKLEVVNIDNNIRAEKLLTLKIDAQTQTGWVDTAIDMTQHYTNFKFRVQANDGSFPPRGAWQVVNVKLPPKLDLLDGQPSPHMSVTPPLYSDLPVWKTLPGARHLEVYDGTQVFLRAKADRPLAQAWLEFRPDNKLTPEAAVLALLGTQNPLHLASAALASDAMLSVRPATLEEDKAIFHVRFTPSGIGKYVLHMRDVDRLYGASEIDVNVLRDPLPDVKLVYPTSAVNAHPDAKVAFKFRVKDETFAVRNVFVEYRFRGPDGIPLPEVHRITLYEGKDFGKLLPSILAKMGRSPLVSPLDRLRHEVLAEAKDQTIRLRPKDLDFETVWALNNQFKVGDVVILEVCSEDYCDVSPFRQPGRSSPIELRITSKPDLVKAARQKLNDIQDHVKKAEQNQKKALDTINDIKKLDKLTQEQKDQLVEAEQLQREVQEQIGKAPDQGLRDQLNKLRDELRKNELKNTDVYDQSGKIKGTLDNIAQTQLPKIEPELADARNEVTQKDKNSPQTKEKLENIAKNQKEVLEAIKDLNKQIAPQAELSEQRAKIDEIRQQQENLLKESERINAEKKNDEEAGVDPKQIDQRLKKEVEKVAKEQLQLAQQMEKAIQEMKKSKEQLDQAGEKKDADKLQKAIDQAEAMTRDEKNKPMPEQDKAPINAEMKKIAQDLANKNEVPQQDIDKQKELLKELDDVAKNLDDPKRDNLAQDIQDRKDARKEIDKMRKDLKKLQEQAKKNEEIKDKEERLKAQEKLAKEHEQLQAQMEKMERRLAQLQEQKAAEEVRQAREDVAKAQKGMQQQNGEPGDMQKQENQENLKEAEKKLEQAKEDLQDAEQELAREMLIQIHDRLKAARDREEALVERSVELHEKIVRRKSWTDPFIDSIDGNIDAQKMIGEETEALREKIKEAKVFNSIMERAKESMDKAGKAMEERRLEAPDRRYIEKGDGELMSKEELDDENNWQTNTVKNQKQAVQRLDRLLDALKQEIAKKPPPRKQEDAAKNDDDPKEPKKKGGVRGGVGIPGMAEIKLLRAEQLDLNERTEEFAKANPDVKQLTDAQRDQLKELLEEQERLRDLFGEVVAQQQPMLEEQQEGAPKK